MAESCSYPPLEILFSGNCKTTDGLSSHRKEERAWRCPRSWATAAVELSVVLKTDFLGDVVFPLVQYKWSFAHIPVCSSGDMWEHTGDLTACHSYDKAEQWVMRDRWMGGSDEEMCCISTTGLHAAVLTVDSHMVSQDFFFYLPIALK